MSPRRVVLTFDYELFLGHSGTVEASLVRPTDTLLDGLAEAGARGCFFVDATHLLRVLEEPAAAGDAARIIEQLGRIVGGGHRVELHVHPHWLDAVWAGHGRWEFPSYRHYSIASLDRTRAVDLIVSAAEALTAAVRTGAAGYQLQAYRAGGFCSQPFDAIAAGMAATGLTIDSSVAPGISAATATHTFDFRNALRNACWRFDTDPLAPCATGRFAELPMTSVRTWPVTRLRRRQDMARRPEAYRNPGDGAHMEGYVTTMSKLLPSYSVLTLESTPAPLLRTILSHTGDTVTFIAHPKTLAPVAYEALEALAGQGVRFLLPAELLAEDCCLPSGSECDGAHA